MEIEVKKSDTEKGVVEKKLDAKFNEPEILEKIVKIQHSQSKKKKTGQFFIQFPVAVVELLNIQKEDLVKIRIPIKNKKAYSITFEKEIT